MTDTARMYAEVCAVVFGSLVSIFSLALLLVGLLVGLHVHIEVTL